MGKKRKMADAAGADGAGRPQHSAATVLVTNLPYSFTNPQLEDAFSDVGPIRRCFLVTKKGTNEHRGLAFVHFAVAEDASRAIELKNGSSVGGRKVVVKHAMHRPSLAERRSKLNETSQGKEAVVLGDVVEEKKVEPKPTESTPKPTESTPKPTESTPKPSESTPKPSESTPKPTESTPKPTESTPKPVQEQQKRVKPTEPKKAISRNLVDSESGSEKQRVARTVVLGGLLSADMADDAHRLAKEIGPVCSVTYPLARQDLEHHALAQDGCKMEASAILYASVKSARNAVELLHQKEIKGGTVWARQLGGEGAKTQKWKLIIRNLPFKAKVEAIKQMFSAAGLVWDVFIPQNSATGSSKGFAFVKFTCKQDAENAIKKFNGQMFGKRPIAVDWAVPKKLYHGGSTDVTNEDGQDRGTEEEDYGSSEDSEDDGEDFDNQTTLSDGEDGTPDDLATEDNFEEEADVARKVLNNLLSSSAKGTDPPADDDAIPDTKKDMISSEIHDMPTEPSRDSKQDSVVAQSVKTTKKVDDEDDLRRTIFISNLPFNAETEEVKQRFSAFGEVQSFVQVLHKVTKRPRGTGFLKFKTADAVDAAVSASQVEASTGLGIFLRGRQLTVLKALDRTSAHKKEMDKANVESQDPRNLYLAKEGVIVEGTPAAAGVSESDMAKREALEREKTTKLRSPKFHVSRTRLIMHNLPKSMTENELKKLCVDAVTSRATKQNPVIKQIKLMKDLKKKAKVGTKDHSRGIAFVEFTEHQHALVALRVLNNNPETFGPQHRPIVAFSLDNVLTLKKQQTWRAEQHAPQGSGYSGPRDEREEQTNKNKRQFKERNKTEKPAQKDSQVKSLPSEVSPEGEAAPKKRKINHENVKEKELPSQRNGNSSKQKVKASKRKPKGAQGGKEQGRGVVEGKGAENGGRRPKSSQLIEPKKRKFEDQPERETGDAGWKKDKRAKKVKQPPGRKAVDKLDRLIEQYRNKFSQQSSDRPDGERQASKQLRRWFQ